MLLTNHVNCYVLVNLNEIGVVTILRSNKETSVFIDRSLAGYGYFPMGGSEQGRRPIKYKLTPEFLRLAPGFLPRAPPVRALSCRLKLPGHGAGKRVGKPQTWCVKSSEIHYQDI